MVLYNLKIAPGDYEDVRLGLSLAMVFLLAPVRREIERIDIPSTIMPRIWARFSRESLFMTKI